MKLFLGNKRNLVLILCCFLVTYNLFAQIVPANLIPAKPANAYPIVDEAGLFTPQENKQLAKQLVAYFDSTSTQIVIVTVKTLHGYEPDQYATEIGHVWGVGGQEKKDNGVVILLSDGSQENNRRKVFIATGYGLEGALPAITCKKIVQQEMIPALKNKQYYQACENAIQAIILAARGEYTQTESTKGKESSSGLAIFFLIVFILIIVLITRLSRRRRYMGNRVVHDDSMFWLLPTIFNSFSGGGSSSSSSDDSSSGFGDFGGGDFGGGGAGGDW